MRRPVVAAFALMLAATACGSRPVALTRDQASRAISVQQGAPVERAAPVRATGTTATSATGAARGSARTGETEGSAAGGFPSGPASTNTMPLTVTLGATCARPGDTMSAKAQTRPGSKLAFAAYYYSDNSFMPDLSYVPAEANPTGTFTWTWVLRPNVPKGDAVVQVVAAKDQKGASFSAPFRVASSC